MIKMKKENYTDAVFVSGHVYGICVKSWGLCLC